MNRPLWQIPMSEVVMIALATEALALVFHREFGVHADRSELS